jgi:spore germination protein KB
MLEGGKISVKQMILLVSISRIIIMIAFLPILVAPPANQDVWLTPLLMVPISLIIAVPIYLLAKRFPNQTLYEYCQSIMGKSGQVVGFLFVWFFLHTGAQSLSYFSTFFTTSIMPETPSLFFIITLTLVSAYAAHHGIEVLGRFSEFIAPLIILSLTTIFLLLSRDMDFQELNPILENGIYPTLIGGLYASSLIIEILALAVILPFLNNPQKTKGVFLFSILLLAVFILIITLAMLTTFGPELATTLVFPLYSAVRLVHVGDFLERIDAIYIGIWILGMFMRVSFAYYLTVLGISQLLHLKDYKPIVFPTGTIMVSLTTLINTNIIDQKEFLSYRIFIWYSIFFILFIPSLLLLTAKIRKKGEHSR